VASGAPEPLKIGLCGLGTVGGTVFQRLADNDGRIVPGSPSLHLQHIGSRSKRNLDLLGFPFSQDVMAVAEDPKVQVLVELIGGCDTARQLVLTAIRNGKHVVTANKALLAEHGEEIMEAAAEQKVAVAFEAAVAGGIPIIRSLRGILASNRIRRIVGILNGTSNYLLSNMDNGRRGFEEILKEAQQKGYAESDPTLDLDGTDAAHKLFILSAIAWGLPLRFLEAAIFREGVQQVGAEDIANANRLGYRIRPLAIAAFADSGILLRVHPALVREKHILGRLPGPLNGIVLQGDLVGDTVYCGPGAGGKATASAVLADLADLATGAIPIGTLRGTGVAPPVISEEMDNICCPRYLRLTVADRPGAASAFASILSDMDISVEEAIQPPKGAKGDHWASLVLLTSPVPEGKLQNVLRELVSREDVQGEVVHLRVEDSSDPVN